MFVRRRLLAALAASLLACGAPGAAWAEDYPARSVQLIVGFGPGGGVDLFARRMAQKLTEIWHQGVVVINKPGADAAIAADYVAHAQPNGYTLLMASNAHAIPPVGNPPGFDPVDSFTPIVLAASNGAVMLVNPALPVKSAQELIAYAKARPGKLNFGNPGIGGTPFMATETFIERTGIDMVGIPFTGGGPALIALMGGQIDLLFGTVSGASQLIQSGKVRALAVSTLTRSASLPDVPTVAEAANLPGFDVTGWFGILGPKGLPDAVVRKVHDDVIEVLRMPDIQAALAKDDYKVVGGSPDEFRIFIRAQMADVANVLKNMKQH